MRLGRYRSRRFSTRLEPALAERTVYSIIYHLCFHRERMQGTVYEADCSWRACECTGFGNLPTPFPRLGPDKETRA